MNSQNSGTECKVTGAVTGETSVRGAVSRMKVEIDWLKAGVVALEQENELLRANHVHTTGHNSGGLASGVSQNIIAPQHQFRPLSQSKLEVDRHLKACGLYVSRY